MSADQIRHMYCPICAEASVAKGFVSGEEVYVCPQCTLWFYSSEVRGRPNDGDWYADLVTAAPQAKYKTRAIGSYLETMKPTFQRQIGELNSMVDERSILDIGCGLGLFLSVAASAGWEVKGLEKSAHAANIAKDFLNVSITNEFNKIPDQAFSVVRLSHVLEHVSNPLEFLSSAMSKLKPGGVSISILPNVHPFSLSAVTLIRKLITKSNRITADMAPGQHILGFNKLSLCKLYEAASMQPIKVFNISMGSQTFYPLFYDGLMTREKISDIDLKTLLRYWLPKFVDNAANAFGGGQWVVGYFRKPLK